ncbi:MAG TPA: hypothetical protein VMS65_14790 [Polyangiaceae bacterium]|nr:hypothetical protein [Polyangiaceae bacterium]
MRSASLRFGVFVTLVRAPWVLCACSSNPAPIAPVAPETPAPATSDVSAAASPALAAEPAPDAPETASVRPDTTRELPTACPAGEAHCTPPVAFAESVCRGKYPELPLLMFQKGTPWPRMYVKAEWVEPVNAYGGERGQTWMHFGEELLILKEHVPGGSKSVAVSGPADVDVLRWDGTCATIRKEMLVHYVPAPMDSAYVIIKYLDANVQEALSQDELVARAREGERRACKGSSLKNPSDGCKKALQKLTDAVVLAVKKGIALPMPDHVPEWKK